MYELQEVTMIHLQIGQQCLSQLQDLLALKGRGMVQQEMGLVSGNTEEIDSGDEPKVVPPSLKEMIKVCQFMRPLKGFELAQPPLW